MTLQEPSSGSTVRHQHPARERHAHRALPRLRADRPAGPHLAGQPHHAGAAVALHRPARRQPGPHRPDDARTQDEDVRAPGPDGLQGDRGRLPERQPDRLRLRAPADRAGQGARGRHDLGAHPGPRGPDRAHRPVARRRAPRQHPPLQRARPAVPPRRLPRRQGRGTQHRRARHRDGDEVRRVVARQDRDRLRVQPRDLHRHRAAVLRRRVRGGLGRLAARRRRARSS